MIRGRIWYQAETPYEQDTYNIVKMVFSLRKTRAQPFDVFMEKG